MRRVVLVVTVAWALACGGNGGRGARSGRDDEPVAAAASAYGQVAYQTYEDDGTSIKFNSDTRVTTWWRNMSCDTVEGTYTQEGDQISIVFKDPENCMDWDEYKLKQMSDCSMANYWRKNPTNGQIEEDDAWIFQRSEPKCPK
jgi:hypothetical protein